jgi:hypothetical protein
MIELGQSDLSASTIHPKMTSKLSVSLMALIAVGTGLAATSVTIYSAVASSQKSQITITGNNLSPSGLAPTIVFAHTQLALASFSNQKVVAQLPTGKEISLPAGLETGPLRPLPRGLPEQHQVKKLTSAPGAGVRYQSSINAPRQPTSDAKKHLSSTPVWCRTSHLSPKLSIQKAGPRARFRSPDSWK